jgi:hypothetical protein
MKQVKIKNEHAQEIANWSDAEVKRDGEWLHVTRQGFGGPQEMYVPPNWSVESQPDGCGCWLPFFLFIAAVVICSGFGSG